jgi:predicted flap endonuclease-1-like 5' DNA nuclease
MAKSIAKLEKANKSLKAEVKKLKKKSAKVVTRAMEPKVLPPAKPKAKPTTRTYRKSTPKKSIAAVAAGVKVKPGPKPKAKPGPKPRTRIARKPAAPGRPASPEDLKFIQGLGAKIESLLNEKGIKTFADLAKSSQANVKAVLEQAGPRFKNQPPKPLIEQAKLVKAEKWSELETLQAKLMEGKGKPGPKAGSTRK